MPMLNKVGSILAITIVVAMFFATPARCVENDEGWQWSLTPYVWATDVSEKLLLDGQVVGGDDTEFDDLVDKIEASLQLHFEGTRDRWGMFADLNYIEVSDSQTGEFGIARIDADIEETLAEAGAIYRPGGRTGKFDLLFGVRYLKFDEDYRLQLGEIEPFDRSIGESYLDGLVAIRYLVPLGERWVISLRGDVSLGDTDIIWTAQGLIGWRFGSRRGSALFLGYRYRVLEYSKTDVFDIEKTLSGFGLGVKIGF